MTWKQYKLGDILKRRKEAIQIQPRQEYKLVTVKLYHKGVTLRRIARGSEIKSSMSTVREGDFILSGIDARNGAFGIVPSELNGAVVTNDFWCLDPDETRIDKDFLLFLTGTQFFDHICKQSSDGTTQRIRLQRVKFFNYQIELPSVAEQRRLVEKLKSHQSKNVALSTELTHQLDLVKQLRQAFLREAMQGKLVPQDPNDEPASELLKRIKLEKEQLVREKKIKKEKDLPEIREEEIPFEVPKGWVWVRLGEIASNIEYGTSQRAEMGSDHIPVLRMNNIQEAQIDYSSLKYVSAGIDDLPKLYLKNGDLLFNRTNSYELVGKSGVYHGENEVMTFASYLIRVQFTNHVSVDFINSWINSAFCRKTQLEPEIIQQNGQANFNGTKLKNILCPFPPLSEQKRINSKLEIIIISCNELDKNIKKSEVQNEQLLQQVLKEALKPNGIH